MQEPLLDRIAGLERSNRRWKWTAGILAAALVGVSLSSVVLGVFGIRNAALQAEHAALLELQAAQAEARANAARLGLIQAELELPAQAQKKE